MFAFDHGRPADWGRTSEDYARYRPGPPTSFYEKLAQAGVGLPGQRVLDLGTGTGLLARAFAKRGAIVAGVDIAEGQIAMAEAEARAEGLEIDFRVAGAEHTPFDAQSFDVITANQCWVYFDFTKTIPELRRLLAPGGKINVSYFNFLPSEDAIVRASEELVLKYNPEWSGGGWDGTVDQDPAWAQSLFEISSMFCYDEEIPFTRESWCGRMRALRGIGASLPQNEIDAFDAEHRAMLKEIAGDAFTISHRLFAHIAQFKN